MNAEIVSSLEKFFRADEEALLYEIERLLAWEKDFTTTGARLALYEKLTKLLDRMSFRRGAQPDRTSNSIFVRQETLKKLQEFAHGHGMDRDYAADMILTLYIESYLREQLATLKIVDDQPVMDEVERRALEPRPARQKDEPSG